jgi:hypothetical protein
MQTPRTRRKDQQRPTVWKPLVYELRPPTGLFFILQVIRDCGEPRWNDIDGIKPKNSENKLSHWQFIHHKSHMYWPGHEPGSPATAWAMARSVTLSFYAIQSESLKKRR